MTSNNDVSWIPCRVGRVSLEGFTTAELVAELSRRNYEPTELPKWVVESVETRRDGMKRMHRDFTGCIKLAIEYEIYAYDWILSIRKQDDKNGSLENEN